MIKCMTLKDKMHRYYTIKTPTIKLLKLLVSAVMVIYINLYETFPQLCILGQQIKRIHNDPCRHSLVSCDQ